jgi:hypothetical protein
MTRPAATAVTANDSERLIFVGSAGAPAEDAARR